MFLSGDYHEDGQEFQVRHLSFFSSPVDSIQAFSIISFPRCKWFSRTGAPLNHSPLAIHLFWSDEDISEGSSPHSQFTLVLLRMRSHSSHLIQPVQSLFSSNCSTVF